MKQVNPSYIGARSDIEKLVPSVTENILDIGCSTGELGASLKKNLGCNVTGIELNPKAGHLARKNIDWVIIGDVEKLIFKKNIINKKQDCIIFADVLEHLVDHWAVLSKCYHLLNKNGVVIASIPNIQFYSVFLDIFIFGRWPYKERGIFDKTHLRQFTLKNIYDLFIKSGFRITKVERKFRLLEKPSQINRYAKTLKLPLIKNYFTFQYLIVAEKDGGL